MGEPWYWYILTRSYLKDADSSGPAETGKQHRASKTRVLNKFVWQITNVADVVSRVRIATITGIEAEDIKSELCSFQLM